MMFYLAVIVLCFTGLQFAVALVNFLFSSRLKTGNDGGEFISVLIPARNEEHNIGSLLNDLRKQSYRNLEIIVFDDDSADFTAEIVKQAAAEDPRIRLIESEGLEEGWLGKNRACHLLAIEARGTYLLFLDADVRIGKNFISEALAGAVKRKTGLLSIFPRQVMLSPGEWSTVPVMNYILLTLLPLILVRKSKFSSFSAANGQFMLFDAAVYRKYLPHSHFRDQKVEDIAIIRYLKQEAIPVACLASEAGISCRMYSTFGEAVHGFSKNIVMFFGGSPVMAILFWSITTLGFIPVLAAISPALIAAYFIAIILIRILVSLTSRQSIGRNLLYLIPQQLSMGLMIYHSIRNSIRKQYTWKGRNIS
jgi:glycosyltransferase involved in cell wall biosynthesis